MKRLHDYARLAFCTLLVLQGAAAHAAKDQPSPNQVLSALRRAHPGTAFGEVKTTPVAGLYEVRMGPNVAYVGANDTRYLLFGHLFDTRTMRDLTPAYDKPQPSATSDAPPPVVDVGALPLGDALKEVKGRGTRTLVLFTDPHCGYCRQLDGELAKLDDVTIYNFMVPMLDRAAPVAIWCSSNRMEAWRAAMRGQEPASASACPHPIDRNALLASRLQVRGTPTMVFSDGSRLESAAGADVVEVRLTAANRSNNHE